MSEEVRPDIAIVGGGIAGIWLLNRLNDAGYNSILFEKHRLGGMQTRAAQGMIHGGIKYTLDGVLSSASEAISSMPDFWKNCLAGTGEVDLQDVALLSESYYMFSDSSFSSRLTTFLGSKVVKGRVEKIAKEACPPPFDAKDFSGKLYRLQDIVLDTRSLISSLTKNLKNKIFAADVQPVMNDSGDIDFLRVQEPATSSEICVRAKLYIFAAGAGNEMLLAQAGKAFHQTQLRSLHQVMIKAPALPPVYAHAFALKSGSLPRMTISTHQSKDGRTVWYIGGELAETGVERSEAEQIHFAKEEIKALFPWIDLTQAEWSTYRVDRAEAKLAGGHRPDSPVVIADGNSLFCWPIKLTLTPMLGFEVMKKVSAMIRSRGGPSASANLGALADLPFPMEAVAPWDQIDDHQSTRHPPRHPKKDSIS